MSYTFWGYNNESEAKKYWGDLWEERVKRDDAYWIGNNKIKVAGRSKFEVWKINMRTFWIINWWNWPYWIYTLRTKLK